MFSQLAIAALAVFLLISGLVHGAALDIAAGSFLLITAAGMFFAARTGSTLGERFRSFKK